MKLDTIQGHLTNNLSPPHNLISFFLFNLILWTTTPLQRYRHHEAHFFRDRSSSSSSGSSVLLTIDMCGSRTDHNSKT